MTQRLVETFIYFAKPIYRHLVLKTRGLEQYSPRPIRLSKSYYHLPAAIELKKLPVISIVTPSYNQGHFIERTINSVLEQNYPNLEYVIQDGGSEDDSYSVIKKYEKNLTYFGYCKDNGQAHAVNLGFEHTHGEIMGYLNSDDVLLPGALWYVANYFIKHPEVDVIYGHRIIIDKNDMEIGRWILPPHNNKTLLWGDYIPQETLFWRRSTWEKISSRLNESFYFALDWDLLLRFLFCNAKFARAPRFLAAFRVHNTQKTSIHINELGLVEAKRLRRRVHNRDVDISEISKNLRPYFLHSFIYYALYKVGILRY